MVFRGWSPRPRGWDASLFFSTLPETTPGAGLPAAAACSALGTPRMASALGTPLMVAPSEGADVEGEPWPAAAARSRSSFALRSAMGTFGRAPAAAPATSPPPVRAPAAKGCGAPAVGPEGKSARGRRRRRRRGRARSAIPVRGGLLRPELEGELEPAHGAATRLAPDGSRLAPGPVAQPRTARVSATSFATTERARYARSTLGLISRSVPTRARSFRGILLGDTWLSFWLS